MKRSALTAVLREEDGVSQPAGIRRRRRWWTLEEAVGGVYLENAKELGLDGRGAGIRAEGGPADRRNTLE